MPREPKLQRWTDLIASLLRRRYPATFEEIARDVPAYSSASKKKDAVMRMFERDKDELRSFGISIDTVQFEDDAGDASGYRLDRKSFYLPYLLLNSPNAKEPRRPDKHWYRGLASLTFEPDELDLIAKAARRIESLGDPVLSEEVESAMSKLSFDLPIPEAERHAPHEDAAAEVFAALNDALERRKRVEFTYHSMSTDHTERRTAEPYGLFFLSSHWYLAARDIDKDDIRNFRLSRIRDVEINASKSQSADYDIPGSFNLRKHAKAKHSWHLGSDNAGDAIVDFRGESGAVKSAARLGLAVEGGADRRKFRIMRMDSFARWLLSFGGDAIPLSPPALVKEFERLVRETRAQYA